MTTLENLVTVSELAKMLKVPKSWVYGKSRQQGPHAIPMIKVGKYCRFNPIDVFEWLNGQGTQERNLRVCGG